MKKLILPLLLLLGITMLVAVESAPSDVVGYFKKSVADGAYQAIALPFAYTDLGVQAVMGDQYLENDGLVEINTGLGTAYYGGFGWDGDLAAMVYGGGYFFNRYAGNGAIDYYLLGKVDPQAFTATIVGNGAYTSFGLNEAAPVTLTDDLFGANETENDGVIEIDSGLGTAYYAGFGWDGDLTTIAPTFAYFYNCVGSSNFDWTYTPTRGSASNTSLTDRNSK